MGAAVAFGHEGFDQLVVAGVQGFQLLVGLVLTMLRARFAWRRARTGARS